jgi:hypothetical protein
LGDDVDDEACEMVLGKAIAQSHAGIEGGLIIGGVE